MIFVFVLQWLCTLNMIYGHMYETLVRVITDAFQLCNNLNVNVRKWYFHFWTNKWCYDKVNNTDYMLVRSIAVYKVFRLYTHMHVYSILGILGSIALRVD